MLSVNRGEMRVLNFNIIMEHEVCVIILLVGVECLPLKLNYNTYKNSTKTPTFPPGSTFKKISLCKFVVAGEVNNAYGSSQYDKKHIQKPGVHCVHTIDRK